MDRQLKDRHHKFRLFKFICNIRIFLVFSFLLFSTFTSAIAAKKHTFEAESGKLIGGASKVADGEASGGFLVSLIKQGDGIGFTSLPASVKLAIRYASSGVGSISVD